MDFVITFLEGIISFISPCMLPMLPVYISYFAGQSNVENNEKSKMIFKVIAFVAGFTVLFTALGLFSGSLGRLFLTHRKIVSIVSGVVVIVFGLSYLELFRLPFFKGMKKSYKVKGIASAFVFGIIYSASLTPCVGAFLGSALMMASQSASMLRGTALLLVYSLGLGIPFVLSAILLDKLSGAFSFIKRNYRIINIISGSALIIVGILMSFGLFDSLLALGM